ncbi:MAG: hypothetical protein M5R40_09875 [Anaerolineae bacterium]|nr:hypothetical protein [Anaerolineae bacterium]
MSADLRVKRVDGDLDVNNVGADATIREVTGDVRIKHVGADLYVRDVAGGCTVDHVGSDMVLNLAFAPGNVYRFNAGSDVVCRVPADTNARFIIVAPQEVRIDEDMASVVSEEGDQQIVTFGAGDAEVYINAGSEVRLVSQPDDTESGFRFGVVSPELDLDFEFSLDLEEKMADVERILSDKLAGLDERLRSTIESQAAKAEREAERLRRRAEKQAERLQRAAERRAKRFHVTWGTPPEPPRPPSPPAPQPTPVSDEERMMILRMVENKQISVEEAERLLAALEGRAK